MQTPSIHKQRFEISLEPSTKILTIKLWGLWDLEEAETFKIALDEEVNISENRDKEWHVLMDLTAYPPQVEEVHHIIAEGLSSLNAPRVAMLARRPMPLFQNGAKSGGIERRIYSYFSAQKDAVRWLLLS